MHITNWNIMHGETILLCKKKKKKKEEEPNIIAPEKTKDEVMTRE